METPGAIRSLAALRLEEAETLIQQGKPDGAFYLAGYSVELTLKAKISERLGVSSLFAEKPLPNEVFTDISKLRQLAQTHNLVLLLVLSGLRTAYEQQKAINATFFKFDDLLWTWSEQLRYRLPGRVDARDVQQFIGFLGDKNGLLQWIDNRLVPELRKSMKIGRHAERSRSISPAE